MRENDLYQLLKEFGVGKIKDIRIPNKYNNNPKAFIEFYLEDDAIQCS